MKNSISYPIAKKKSKKLKIHHDTRIDDYYWLNDKDNPEVIDYLNSENAYTKQMMSHTEDFQKALFNEMKGRIKEDDTTVPYKLNGYWYITRYEKGKDYPIYLRKKESLEAAEEILFDCNEMAKDYAYFNLGSIAISPNNKLASFSTDTVSRRQYTIQIKNLETGEIYSDKILNTTGSAVWANDNETLFYTIKDELTLRSHKIFKHKLCSNTTEDSLVFHEKDETYNTFVYKSKSRKYIIIGSSSTLTSEYRILNANTPDGKFKIFQKRVRELDYSIAHFNDVFYIIANSEGAKNFKLLKTHETKTKKEFWEEVLPHRNHVLIEDIEIFKDYLVVNERENGLNNLRIMSWNGKEDYYLPFESETYTAYIGNNPDFDSDVLRYGYNSLTSPSAVIDYNFYTKQSDIKKEQKVLGDDFDKNDYESKRLWATARDGVKVPISMVYKKGIKLNGENPLLLYAYGSYGSTIDPSFSTIRLSLLNRGFIYAIAHVRGGEYLGRQWYENGKLLSKLNTFHDYIDCSKFLITEKYTSKKHLYAYGGSAGGLLVGAVINMNPELYHGVLAAVPFVDVVTTMLDDTIPLTTGEYDEWGNPHNKEYYHYIKLYSPYDNVEQKNYPNMLITTGLYDSQVQYWEPAKWVAKLRAYKKDSNKILFHIDMDSGHGGASGRFESLKEVALEYAFLLDLEGIHC
ncbi:MAG: S9 family peptidase [Flavobacteriales bacterium]|nr:S9 family peptidase [Flavobacteriia bacterium]NCP06514.1 S9 family peptidase [Flavobacteriales bacterium]PIV92954.1 MAG: oligopeptidase B [Flavobacteriaceae bacterium CG17_big_fil_post_rev_8_21_14_2_50_33_15]PIY11851.1 MAG: oligopeptidase B [Flavobacteriaceae bacterium CG_4_10_14_3_um_filter_33_47]PJB20701.1 MAG: oligopeptidase B [Flavobacteriaceae bacterium CG_4_9_14_3_um_filter_33_16]